MPHLNSHPLYGILAALVLGPILTPPSSAQEVDLDTLCVNFPQNSRCEEYRDKPWKANPPLAEGDAIANREQDRFQGQVLIPLPQDQVWQVLTDYNNFSDFLPGVIENQATVTQEGNSQRSLIMTSTSVNQVLLARIQSTIELELQEQPTEQIAFSLISGDNLSQLEGTWQLETIAPPDTPPFQGSDTATLVTYRATAITSAGPQGIFANIFESQIRTNLTAIQQESLRRFSS